MTGVVRSTCREPEVMSVDTPTTEDRSGHLGDDRVIINDVLHADHTVLANALRLGQDAVTYAIGKGLQVAAAEFLAKCRQTLNYPPTLVMSPVAFVSDRSQIRDCDVWVFDGGEGADDLAVLEDAVARGARQIRFVTTEQASVAANSMTSMPGVEFIVVPATASSHSTSVSSFLATIAAFLIAACRQNSDPELDAAVRTFASDAAEKRFSTAHLALVRSQMDKGAGTSHLTLLADPGLRAVSAVFRGCVEPELITFIQSDINVVRHVSRKSCLLLFRGPNTRHAFSRIIGSAGGQGAITLDYNDCGRLQTFLAILDAVVLVQTLCSEERFANVSDQSQALHAPYAAEDDLLSRVRQRGPAVRQKQAAHSRRDPPAFQDIVWPAAFESFCDGLAIKDIMGVVLDYDGTIIEPDDPETLPTSEMVAEILRLLDNGITVAIATGRGPSLGDALRPLLPKACWEDITVGYYNGSYLKPLSVDISLEPPVETAEIQALVERLSQRPDLFRSFRPVNHGVQLTLERDDLIDHEQFRSEFIVSGFGEPLPLKLLCSGAWYDFVHIGASKRRVFTALASTLPPGAGILCIGDNGNRAGNDYELLGHPLGLSVGNVCDRPSAGWSLYGETCTGPAALQKILRGLQPVTFRSMRFSRSS
ncbi:HAD family hydrolase [Agrobacterium tumefaciens]|uniref:HAD family hydrolase n=1 Tax=Agrobacterium tumefaciens TaxID=358 RepID=UPI001FD213E6|nr:HAD hydrolase family protein [Agrobacterium tumefaciens]